MNTVLITGASRGIGLEFARQYAARGWTVIATHRHATTPEALSQLAGNCCRVHVEHMDVTDHDQIDSLARKLASHPIDVLLNNAGLIRSAPIDDADGNADQRFGTFDYRRFDQFMRTNVAGPLKVAEAFSGHLKASRQKKLVAISSAAGVVSVLPRNAEYCWYRVSKAALNCGMRTLAVALRADRVTVVMFHPGAVRVESLSGVDLAGFVTTDEAVANMIAVIDGLTILDTGRFLQSDGIDHPW